MHAHTTSQTLHAQTNFIQETNLATFPCSLPELQLSRKGHLIGVFVPVAEESIYSASDRKATPQRADNPESWTSYLSPRTRPIRSNLRDVTLLSDRTGSHIIHESLSPVHQTVKRPSNIRRGMNRKKPGASEASPGKLWTAAAAAVDEAQRQEPLGSVCAEKKS
jgi:hypothetical protein